MDKEIENLIKDNFSSQLETVKSAVVALNISIHRKATYKPPFQNLLLKISPNLRRVADLIWSQERQHSRIYCVLNTAAIVNLVANARNIATIRKINKV